MLVATLVNLVSTTSTLPPQIRQKDGRYYVELGYRAKKKYEYLMTTTYDTPLGAIVTKRNLTITYHAPSHERTFDVIDTFVSQQFPSGASQELRQAFIESKEPFKFQSVAKTEKDFRVDMFSMEPVDVMIWIPEQQFLEPGASGTTRMPMRLDRNNEVKWSFVGRQTVGGEDSLVFNVKTNYNRTSKAIRFTIRLSDAILTRVEDKSTTPSNLKSLNKSLPDAEYSTSSEYRLTKIS